MSLEMDVPTPTPLAAVTQPEQRAADGRAARQRLPRSAAGEWTPAPDRPDPVEVLVGQCVNRVPDLVPIRFGRMSESAFAFYRGAAAVMAADLGRRPNSGIMVQACGDAHLANFGGFASPERSMVFDINDFDETHRGPFEWDVARLVASIEIAARHRGFSDAERDAIVSDAARAYCQAMTEFAAMGNLDIWYAHIDADALLARVAPEVGPKAMARFQKAVRKAESKDRLKARARLTEEVDGELRFKSDPPLLVPVSELFSADEHAAIWDVVSGAIDMYRLTLAEDRRHLVERYRFVDLARKVVGVGSVGTRCWVALLVGRDNDDPLFLQVKEAEASVLAPYVESSGYPNQGQRVVEGQRLTQATSDILLGWQHVSGTDGLNHDYYLRQLWDWKASADLETMEAAAMGAYGQACGWTLARSHARSGDAIAIAAYLGSGGGWVKSFRAFATRYADQNEIDHQGLLAAIAAGKVPSLPGV